MRQRYKVLIVTILSCSGLTLAAGTAKAADPVLVRIGDEAVTVEQFEAYLALLHPHVEFRSLSPAAQQRELDEYLERRLLALRARELGLDAAPATRTRIEFFTDGVLAEALRQRMVSAIDVSTSEMRAYYRDHQHEFRAPPRLLLEHIVYNQARSASHAREKLLGGATYEGLLADRSRDPGLVYSRRGWLTPELLIPEIVGPVMELAPGQVSEVLQSSYGHHVIRLVEREAAYIRPFEEARGQIVGKMQRKKAADYHAGAIADIRDTHKVEIHLDELRARGVLGAGGDADER